MRNYIGIGTYIVGMVAMLCATAVLNGALSRVWAAPSAVYQVVSTRTRDEPGTVLQIAQAHCPAGEHVLGGGGRVENGGSLDRYGILIESIPIGNSSWQAAGIDNVKGRSWNIAVFAICAKS